MRRFIDKCWINWRLARWSANCQPVHHSIEGNLVAGLLYRLGRASAQRAWLVVSAWLILLAAAGGAFVAFGGTLASSFSIPGTETERVTEALAEDMPQLTGSSGTVVFITESGEPFTGQQRAEIGVLLDRILRFEGVTGTTNPFRTEAERAEREQTLTDGAAQLADGSSELDAARDELVAGQAQLDDAIALARNTGTYGLFAEQFEQQQAQITDGFAQVAQSRGELLEQSQQLADATRLMEFSSELRLVSAEGNAAVGMVAFEEGALTLPPEVKEAVAGALDDAIISGVRVGYSSTIGERVDGLLGVGEVVGIAIAALVLLVMMRSALPAMTPLLSSVIGVGVGVAGSLALSGVVDMASVTPVLGVMLGLAVGIDYALFILNRHRTQVLAGADIHESIGLANGTSGNAVVFAGSTVMVALLALGVTGIPFLTVMGIVAAACVLVAVAVSITLMPALLSLLGKRVVGKRARARIGKTHLAAAPAKAMRTRTAVVMGVAGTLLLLVIALPALSMRLGLPDGSAEEPDSPQYLTYDVLREEFGPGINGPLLVVARMPQAVAETDTVATQAQLAHVLSTQPDVVAVAPIATSPDRTVFAFQVIPAEGPSSESTEHLVRTLRELSPLSDGVELGVAGQASGSIDISAKLADALPVYLAVVVGLSMIILILVFRSLLVPVVATGGFVLSLFAALGAVTAVYQWGWLSDIFGVHSPGPILSFAPILIMGVLFGLAMDYQLFLVSGMREAYVHGVDARTAVVTGVRHGRAVVTAAAIIMISVFGGFVFSHLGMVRPIGFGLAIGVLFDAFVVRMVLVPSAMHLLGDKAWWLPAWLDRIMPNVDVEGAALERTHPLHQADELKLITA
jgi:RND superfamily putative drug exporter